MLGSSIVDDDDDDEHEDPPSMSDSLHLPIPVVGKFPHGLADGVVGLGIVAALNGSRTQTHKPTVGATRFPPRSTPIPINQGSNLREKSATAAAVEGEAETELSESFTRVILRSRDDSVVSKRVYFDHGSNGVDVGVVFELSSPPLPPPPKATFPVCDFLSCCFLCGKSLHGLDAFIYRGEKAFCSVQCRYHITREEAKGRNTAEVTKPFTCSSSPCSAPFPFATGLAAA